MNDLELKQLWQRQSLPSPPPASDREIIDQMKRKLRRFDRNIFWRDVREIAACLFLIVWFGFGLGHKASALTHLGNIIVMLSCVFIAAKLLAARREQRAFLNPRSVREFLLGETAKVSRQIRLLQTVLWWYLLPILCGAMIAVLGGPHSLVRKMIVLLSFIPIGWFVHWLNQYAARRVLQPLKTELDLTLNSVPEFSEPENQHHPEERNP